MTALDATLAGMPAAAHETMADVIERGAQAMYVRPWKIGETILNRSEWPVPGKSLGDLLEAGRRQDAMYRRQHENGAWWYDANLHIAVKQACRAIEIIAAEVERLPERRAA